MTLLFLGLVTELAGAEPASAKELAAGEFSLVAEGWRTPLFSGGEHTEWRLRMSSDGATAWVVGEMEPAQPVFVPPQPNTSEGRSVDYTPDGQLIVWRHLRLAVKYDLLSGLTERCVVLQNNMVSADGKVTTIPPSGHIETTWIDQESTWAWIWMGLGDASTGAEQYVDAVRTGRFKRGLPLAAMVRTGGGKPTQLALRSFVQEEDDQIEKLSRALFAEFCD